MSVETHKVPMIFSIPFLPPSSNHIYVNKRGGGGRFLSKYAQQYKVMFKNYVGQNYFQELMSLNPEGIYYVFFKFMLSEDDVINKTFGQKNGAKTRYKKLDTTNRIKLVEDCLKEVTGIDDSQFFLVKAGKYISPNPHLQIQLLELPESDFRHIA